MAQDNSYSHSEENLAVTYKKRLNSWAIARLLPDTKQEIVARFRSRSDADGRLQLMRQMSPEASLMLVFDCHTEEVGV